MRRKGVALSGLAMIAAGLVWAAIAWADTADFKIQKPSGKYETVTVDDDDGSTYKTYRYEGLTKEGRVSRLRPEGGRNRRPGVDNHHDRWSDGQERRVSQQEAADLHRQGRR